MTEDQLAVNRNAITLQSGNLDLDVLLPDINWSDPRTFFSSLVPGSRTETGISTLKTVLVNFRAIMSHDRPILLFKLQMTFNLTLTILGTVLT
jgi:hypothetical protein